MKRRGSSLLLSLCLGAGAFTAVTALTACVVYEPVPAPQAPSTFERSWNAINGAMVDQGVTIIEQDWDIVHGFAVLGNENAELILPPGQTKTLKWVPKTPGVYPFYCTDFCSALHQEMQGYVRVSPAGSTVALSAGTSAKAASQMARMGALPGHKPGN